MYFVKYFGHLFQIVSYFSKYFDFRIHLDHTMHNSHIFIFWPVSVHFTKKKIHAVGINHIYMRMSETVNLVILTSKCFNICSAVSLISLFFRYLKEVGNEEKFYFLLIQFFLVLRPHLKVAKCDNIFSFWGNRFVQCRYTYNETQKFTRKTK